MGGILDWFGEKKSHYDMRKSSLFKREFQVISIMSEPEFDLDMAVVTDAKSLYDDLSREQLSGTEKRAALEICVIRDFGVTRWKSSMGAP